MAEKSIEDTQTQRYQVWLRNHWRLESNLKTICLWLPYSFPIPWDLILSHCEPGSWVGLAVVMIQCIHPHAPLSLH